MGIRPDGGWGLIMKIRKFRCACHVPSTVVGLRDRGGRIARFVFLWGSEMSLIPGAKPPVLERLEC